MESKTKYLSQFLAIYVTMVLIHLMVVSVQYFLLKQTPDYGIGGQLSIAALTYFIVSMPEWAIYNFLTRIKTLSSLKFSWASLVFIHSIFTILFIFSTEIHGPWLRNIFQTYTAFNIAINGIALLEYVLLILISGIIQKQKRGNSALFKIK